ncbi:MAG TPA: DUF4340 domain-containing protein [Gemmatimonadales bacterium]|nr:DUF4340 domain-containing protein [Gemmatimonadales bacterium]
MSANQLRVIALALMLLVCVWLGARLLSHKSDVIRGSLTLPPVKAGQTDSIVIRHGADTLRLVRAGTAWTVNGYRAGKEPVGQLFLAFIDTTVPDLAAVSPGSFRRMGVDSSSGYWLRVWSGGQPTVKLVIGALAAEASSGYVRREGSDSILLWRGNLVDLARREVNQWRDKQIGAVVPESVVAVNVTARRSYGLRRSGASWRFAAGGPADSGRVAGLLAQYRNFTASGFGSAAQADSGKKPAARRTLALVGAGGAKLLELTFDSSSTGIWARRTGDADNVYRVDAWRLNSFVPPDSALRPAPPAKATSPAHH